MSELALRFPRLRVRRFGVFRYVDGAVESRAAAESLTAYDRFREAVRQIVQRVFLGRRLLQIDQRPLTACRGDEVLREVSRRLSELVRASDTVARYGGDEFVVLAPDVGDEAAASAARIAKAFDEPIVFDGGPLVVAVSAGASAYPADGTNADALLRRADEALYRVKARRTASLPTFATESGPQPA